MVLEKTKHLQERPGYSPNCSSINMRCPMDRNADSGPEPIDSTACNGQKWSLSNRSMLGKWLLQKNGCICLRVLQEMLTTGQILLAKSNGNELITIALDIRQQNENL